MPRPARGGRLRLTVGSQAVTDAQLVARCRQGDERAWAEFVDRFARYVYAITRIYRLPARDVEDVFQEAFARAFERLPDLRDATAVRSWLGQLTRRLALDRLRRSAAEIPSAELPEPEDVDETLASIDDALVVREALAGLPEDCREILDRFFARDESYRTIEQDLAIPAGTIASRISRCLAKLRAELEGRSEGSRPSSV
jgi:RNA polymerase sigma factor (sigma-70 family)